MRALVSLLIRIEKSLKQFRIFEMTLTSFGGCNLQRYRPNPLVVTLKVPGEQGYDLLNRGHGTNLLWVKYFRSWSTAGSPPNEEQ